MAEPDTPQAPAGPLPVLYEDDAFVAVHKPPGLLVHRSWLSGDRVFLLQLLRDQIGRRVYPVHRLDRATSGVIIFAFSSRHASALQQRLESADAVKRYRAVVRGWIREAGEIDHPVRDRDEGGEPREAVTRYRPLATVELPCAVGRYSTARYSLVEVQPLTGRRQQIRKHLKHIAHPVVGDTTHGRGEHNRLFRQAFDCHRLLLQARELCFRHPLNDEPVGIRAAAEPSWDAVIARLGWSASDA
ncbi:MAG: pseudouridine synthase [Gammaproteobacteria bacterium]|jgi:tRNA pseudouridine65 synthase